MGGEAARAHDKAEAEAERIVAAASDLGMPGDAAEFCGRGRRKDGKVIAALVRRRKGMANRRMTAYQIRVNRAVKSFRTDPQSAKCLKVKALEAAFGGMNSVGRKP